MARAGVARPPAVSARLIQACAACPAGVCTRMATSRLSTRSLARQHWMTPVGVGSSGPPRSSGRELAGGAVVVDVIDTVDPLSLFGLRRERSGGGAASREGPLIRALS